MRRLIYPINWLASKLMIIDGSSPISSLVPDCNPPKAATLVLADGTLVPVLPLCQASARGNPKRHYRNSHTASHLCLCDSGAFRERAPKHTTANKQPTSFKSLTDQCKVRPTSLTVAATSSNQRLVPTNSPTLSFLLIQMGGHANASCVAQASKLS